MADRQPSESYVDNRADLRAGLALKMEHLSRLLATIAREPGNTAACLEAGRICWQMGEILRAVTLFREAHRRSPEDWEVVRYLAAALAAWDKPGQARRLCLEYLKNHPGSQAAVDFLLALEKDLGTPEKDIDLDGFLSDEATFVEIAASALLPGDPGKQRLPQWRNLYQRQGSLTRVLAAIANTSEFKKQAVSWFVCGNARLFLEKNSRLWSKNPLPDRKHRPEQGYILTSFLHPDPTNKVRNGLIAKYLQHRFGCPIMAVGIDGHYKQLHRQLAASFKMESYCHLEPEDHPPMIQDRLRQAQGHTLRKQILAARIDGLPVGDLIYDQYVRWERQPTIEKYDLQLEKHLHRAASLIKAFKSLFRNNRVAYLVVDHLAYLRWGILARVALECGATVISHHGRSSPVIARVHRPGQLIPEYEARITPEHFEYLFRTRGRQMANRGHEIVRRYYREQKPHKHTLVKGEKYRLYDRSRLLGRLGMDPRLPVVFIMAHTMTDAPHMMGPLLFDDYFQWLSETLEMAASIAGVNWIVKEHPFASVYTGRHDALELAAPHAAATTNIGCCPFDFHPGGLLDCADAVVTARGTAGLETAVFGKPCVLAGKSAYSGLGFTIDPPAVPAYRSALESLAFPRPLPETATMRARACAYLFFEASRIPCSLLPDQPLVSLDPMPDDIQWGEMARSIETFRPDRDPLYRSLLHALDGDLPYLMHLDDLDAGPEESTPKEDTEICPAKASPAGVSC